MADPRICPACGRENTPTARFCGACGVALDATSALAPQVEAMRWRRRPGEVAARLRAQDLGRQGGDLVIEEGTTALVLRDGQVVEQQPAGRYPLATGGASWWSRLVGGQQETGVVLIDNGVIGIDLVLTDLWTLDPLRLTANCRLALQLGDASRFVRTVMKDRQVVTVEDVRALLEPEVRNAAQVYVAEHSVEQLDAELAGRREDFGVDVRERLRDTLTQMGLTFMQVRVFELHHPRFDRLRQAEEELFLGPVELHNKRRLLDQYNQEQLLAIAQEEAEVAHAAQRDAIRRRVARLAAEDRIARIQDEEGFNRFLAEVDRGRLLREDELAQLRQALLWGGEDRAAQRAQVIALTQLQGDFDLKQARLEKQFAYDQARLQQELELARAETFGRLELQQRRLALELEQQAMQAAHAREMRRQADLELREKLLQDEAVRLQVALAAARNQLETAQIRVQIERLEDDNDLLTAEKAQAMMRRNREEKLRIEREHWLAVQTAQLEQEERRLRLQLEERRQAQAHELARMAQLNQLSAEALILIAESPEKASFVADLKRTELLRGYSEEQIAYMVAERQPAVVEAIKARYAAAANGQLGQAESEKWKALAEAAAAHHTQLERNTQAMLERSERANRENADRQERLANQALDKMADVAKAFAQRPEGRSTTVITPGAGGGLVVGGGHGGAPAGAPAEVQVCPECRYKMAVGVRFCGNCGHKFF